MTDENQNQVAYFLRNSIVSMASCFWMLKLPPHLTKYLRKRRLKNNEKREIKALLISFIFFFLKLTLLALATGSYTTFVNSIVKASCWYHYWCIFEYDQGAQSPNTVLRCSYKVTERLLQRLFPNFSGCY